MALVFTQDALRTKQHIIEQRTTLRHHHDILNQLNIDLLDLYRHVDQFLLDPSQGNKLEMALAITHKAAARTKSLTLPAGGDSDLFMRQVRALDEQLSRLGISLEEKTAMLMDIRRQIRQPELAADDMERAILPETNTISAIIASLNAQFRQREQLLDDQYRALTNRQNMLLFAIIALFLVFAASIIYSLDLMVFRPISNIAQALKARAFNQTPPEPLSSNTLEIRTLVDAFEEMDSQISQRQRDLEHQALHDHLTGLPNRLMLTERIDYHLLTSERTDDPFTLFMMDLNNFKDVNDSLGHAVGDQLLVNVSRILEQTMRKSDTIARLGGDEFAVLIPCTTRRDSKKLAQKLLQQLSEPIVVDGRELNVGLSIGIVHYPEDGKETQTLLQHADIAMYHAKRHKTGYAFYTSGDDYCHGNRLTLISDLATAIDDNTLEIHFQPLFDISSKTISGAEALLRWHHPVFGPIQPDRLIELAEYSGLINKLSLWVLDAAVAQCAAWHSAGHPISVSVNLSAHDLANRELCESVARTLERHGLEPACLTLEITESGVMHNPARTIGTLKSLSDMNVRLAIDDFGTGFSSLSYLKRFPVKELKIDKSFVLDMDHNDIDDIIVQSTVNLGHNLGLRVIAEGIERPDLLDRASNYGCDQVQGYLFGKPKNSPAFLEFLQQYKKDATAFFSTQVSGEPA